MGFVIGSIVFVGGSAISLSQLGLTWQAGVVAALCAFVGAKIAK